MKATSVDGGKAKAMVYLPQAMHTEVKLLAARRGCRISDVYAEATAAYLTDVGMPSSEGALSTEAVSHGSEGPDHLASIASLLSTQVQAVQELVDKVDLMAGKTGGGVGSAMTLDMAAYAVASTLRLLANAGKAGILKSEVTEFGRSMRIRTGLTHALYALKGVGLARSVGDHWYGCWPPVQGSLPPFIRGPHAAAPKVE